LVTSAASGAGVVSEAGGFSEVWHSRAEAPGSTT
jgi:hypothetical protein